MSEPRRSRVFISYSHDSDAHRAAVLALAQRLRGDGQDVWIDQYEQAPDRGWQQWMLDQLDRADFVLVVCTATYRRRFEGKEEGMSGRGVDREARFISQELYDEKGSNRRFLPVLLDGAEYDDIPRLLRTYQDYWLPRDHESLLGRLTQLAAVQPATLGSVRRPARSSTLLPWLADRAPQLQQVGDALDVALDLGRPVACVLRGDEREAHGRFLECLEKAHLPALLPGDRDNLSVRELSPKWPRGGAARAIDRLRKELAQELTDRRKVDDDGLVAAIAAEGRPLLVQLSIPTSSWSAEERGTLEAITAWWTDLPLPPASPPSLLVAWAPYPAEAQGIVASLFRNRGIRKRNAEVEKDLAEIAAALADAVDLGGGSEGQLLPPLIAVDKDAVHEWSARNEVVQAAGGRDLGPAVQTLFAQADTIPMQDLAPRLAELLSSESP